MIVGRDTWSLCGVTEFRDLTLSFALFSTGAALGAPLLLAHGRALVRLVPDARMPRHVGEGFSLDGRAFRSVLRGEGRVASGGEGPALPDGALATAHLLSAGGRARALELATTDLVLSLVGEELPEALVEHLPAGAARR